MVFHVLSKSLQNICFLWDRTYLSNAGMEKIGVRENGERIVCLCEKNFLLSMIWMGVQDNF